jgi:hypothetical protein
MPSGPRHFPPFAIDKSAEIAAIPPAAQPPSLGAVPRTTSTPEPGYPSAAGGPTYKGRPSCRLFRSVAGVIRGRTRRTAWPGGGPLYPRVPGLIRAGADRRSPAPRDLAQA